MDKGSCGVQPPHDGFPSETLGEDFAGQGLAERFMHCTCVWNLRQVPNRGAVPSAGLIEIGLRGRSGNEMLAAANPS